MSFIEIALLILLLACLSIPIATRFRLPQEIFLVAGSCIIGLIPGLPFVQIKPIIVFQVFLPPILFYSAYFTSWNDLKFNKRPILLLAFGLTLFTSFVVAAVAVLLLPGFTWIEGLLLGAIVSPTDASSAIAIIKRIGGPRRLLTLLSGESLINDAAALILFRFCLATMIVGNVSISGAIARFFIVCIGGAAIGLLLGIIAIYLIRLLKDTQSEITMTFLVAFLSFILAEQIGVSGVISTVVCGLYFGIKLPLYASSKTRVNAKSNWNILIFIINGFIFTIIGLQLPYIIHSIKSYSIMTLLLYGSIISAVVIFARLLWVFPAAYLPRFFFKRIVKKDPMPPWQFLVVLGWSGMRGIISLAAALSIPILINNKPFEHRDLILFITYCVIVATLLLPTLTLPVLLRIFKLKNESQELLKEEVLARIHLTEAVMNHICDVAEKEKIPESVLTEYKKQIQRRKKTIESQLADLPYTTLSNEYHAIKKLALMGTKRERRALLKLRKEGKIHEEIFHLLLDEIDLEEVRIRSIRF